ncbi:hypothetical protein F7725_028510 [Dissostichus mawsoni]|uniref:Uncharacterized protein n=1 Tax=Dissostichus mawsoni TaxID=36200 RepID=A0A7J5XFW6_DISMA|nr:hypothetical protein F7725_028510 [Dissostichus mawsoni]
MLRSGVRERPTCGSDWWSRQCIPELHLQGSCATFLLLVERTRTAPSALCAVSAQLAQALPVSGEGQFCSALSLLWHPCRLLPPPLKSGGTLSVAQRDSAVSGYNPCAAEPPGHSAALGKHK